MELQLKNIGMIENANLKIDGLTVIAGENDTGKSTVGKALFALIKADMISLMKYKTGQAKDLSSNRKRNFDRQIDLLFEGQIANEGTIHFKSEIYVQEVNISNNKTVEFRSPAESVERIFKDAVFLQTPLVWDLFKTFRGIANLKSESELLGISTKIKFPYLQWDLYVKLTNEPKLTYETIKDIEQIDVSNIIKGEFKQDKSEEFKFYRENNEIEISNVSTGIKQFGTLQVLLANGQIEPKRLMIIDEPEVHLHPKWQLEMAKIIVELVKNDVKVLVNSHSPYMIEALKRYSDIAGIEDKTNFYLAENGYIKKVNESNSEILEKIFEKLSEPFDTFEEMDSKRMEKLVNG